MHPKDFIPVNFSFAPGALAALEEIRAEHNAAEEDKFLCFSIGWGRWSLNSGITYENVAIGIYGQSSRVEVEPYLQKVDGWNVMYFVTPEDYPKLQGLQIDCDPKEGFFLRDPTTGRDNRASQL